MLVGVADRRTMRGWVGASANGELMGDSDDLECTTMVVIIPDIQSAFKVSGTGMVRMQFDSFNLEQAQQLMKWGNHKIAATFAPIKDDCKVVGDDGLEKRRMRKSEWETSG